MFSLRLSPSGRLHPFDEGVSPPLDLLFREDWRGGWFSLAADRVRSNLNSTSLFWQDIASEYIRSLCHLPREEEFRPLDPPTELLGEWLLKAPPMVGGEYLTLSRLRAMWEELNQWVEVAVSRSGGVGALLEEHAPKWRQVGRVCFHLAENRSDKERPFAFLATYSAGFGATGKVRHLPLRKALEQYAGERSRDALLRLLVPVQNAAERCDWVQQLLSSGELYQPLAWTIPKAHSLLQSVPELEESGLSVRIPNWWRQRSRPCVAVKIGEKERGRLGMDAMLDFDVSVALEGERLSAEELRQLLSSCEPLVSIRGQWVEVDRDRLQEALDHWNLVQNQSGDEGISFIEGMRLLAGLPAGLKGEGERNWVSVSAGEALSSLLASLRDPALVPMEQALDSLNATLRPYQQEGVSWLSLLSGLGLGACLADDMGLGKTIQILSLLLLRKERDQQQGPSLLVVPASLLGNWKLEADRFAPSLDLRLVHSSVEGPRSASDLEGCDLVVTTYTTLLRQEWIAEVKWDLMILDEAQAIKNSETKQSRAARSVKANGRIALTGTPIENRLSDLWALFDFLNPGLLGSASCFQSYVKEMEGYGPLRQLVSPYILRRMKSDPKVISDLPEKIEMTTHCQLTQGQARAYQSVVSELERRLDTVDSMERRGLVLQTLMRLKQICNHPALFTGEGDFAPSESGKLLRLAELCEELAERQERVLLFTQFREMIDPLAGYLAALFGRPGLLLHGGTSVRKRQELVEEFQQEDGPPFFILSLRAGGTGLTLTAASHVIHFDRWWNPAVENQATDRAFRIGQKRNVQVHKMVTLGTIEEEIDRLISSKSELANEILSGGGERAITELSDQELIRFVSLNVQNAVVE